MKTTVYRLHGMRVRSEIPLHERICPIEGDDVVVLLEKPAEPRHRDGTLVAELDVGGHTIHQVVREPSGGHVLRATGVCDFEISEDLSVIRCVPDPRANPGWVPILLRGSVMAVLLDLTGRPSLHASAVAVDGRIIAFAGYSNSGKSTAAALLCANGARLVSDDVLAVDIDGSAAVCNTGSRELRLRPSAVGLLDEPGWIVSKRRVADGRLAVRPRSFEEDFAQLAAVVFPKPSRSLEEISVVPIPPTEAVLRMVSVPRIRGWTDPLVLEQALTHAVELADSVPVFEALMPWGPPWRPSLTLPLVETVTGVLV